MKAQGTAQPLRPYAQRDLGTVVNGAYRIQVSHATDHPDWDAFLAETAGGHHTQTSLWAQVKASLGWQAARVVVKRGERIVAGAQLLVRPLPLAGAVGYVPKGPVFASDDPLLPDLIIDKLHQVARAHRVHYLILQPPDNGEALVRHLPHWGFQPCTVRVFPTVTVVIDLDQDLDVILANMKPKTRYNIRLGQRKGITVREGTDDDLPTFYQLLAATCQRQGFSINSEAYYSEMRRILSPFGYFKLFLAEYQGEAVSAMLAIPFGDTVTYKRGGWSGHHGDRRPNEIMHWAALTWAKAHGYRYYNFDGIDPLAAGALLRGEPLPATLVDSVTRFKIGFGGQLTFMPGVYDYVYNPVLRCIYNTAYQRIANWSVTKKIHERLRPH
jgi:lipid II:glycine glycyltransferase (peptidoglycan interpeptide bridge formation enzyme)